MVIYITEPLNERVTTSSLLIFRLEGKTIPLTSSPTQSLIQLLTYSLIIIPVGDIFNLTNVYHLQPQNISLSINVTLDQRELQFLNGNKYSVVLNNQDFNIPTIKIDMSDHGLHDGAHEVIVQVNVNDADGVRKSLRATKTSYFYFYPLVSPVTPQKNTEITQLNDNVVADNYDGTVGSGKTVQIVFPQVRLTISLAYSM